MISNRAIWAAVLSTSLISSAALAQGAASEQPAAAASPADVVSPADTPATVPATEAQPVPTEPTPAAPAAAPEAPTPAAPGASVAVGQNTLPPLTEGMGQVVFYRPSKLGGMALKFSVREEGKGLGKLGNGSYFVLAATPGTHTYTIESEATDRLTLEVDAGETYYVEQTIGMGIMMGRPHLAPATAEAFGRKALKLSTRKGNDDPELAQNQTAAPTK